MLSYPCQLAFSRFDHRIRSGLIDRPFCPGIVKKAYDTVKGMLA
jgi:hypothetical protein